MKTRVAEVREITADRKPLCVLRNGTPIYHSSIGEYLRSFSGLGASHEDATRYLQDLEFRREFIERVLRKFYLLPDFMISYP